MWCLRGARQPSPAHRLRPRSRPGRGAAGAGERPRLACPECRRYFRLQPPFLRKDACYAYNGDGTLVSATVDGRSTGYTQDLAGSLSQILASATGGTTSEYLRDDGGILLANVTGGTRTWYGADNQGSVRQVLDDVATVLASQSYDPYGSPESSANVGIFGYTGELQDGTTNAEYLRARWYQPGTGTLLGVDPELDSTGQAYTYAGDDPVGGSDPSGACWTTDSKSSRLLIYDHLGGKGKCDAANASLIFNGPGQFSDHSYALAGAALARLAVLAEGADYATALKIVAAEDSSALGEDVVLATRLTSTGTKLQLLKGGAEAVDFAAEEAAACSEAGIAGSETGVGDIAVVLVAVGVVAVGAILLAPPSFDLGRYSPYEPAPAPTAGNDKRPPQVLFHYTDPAGTAAILASGFLAASSEDAAFGPGQYFTDLPPTGLLTQKEYSLALFRIGTGRALQKVIDWLAIDVAGLPVQRVRSIYKDKIASARRATVAAYGIWLLRGTSALPVADRLRGSATTLFASTGR